MLGGSYVPDGHGVACVTGLIAGQVVPGPGVGLTAVVQGPTAAAVVG
eukprot:COSAG01_NODE_66740_length_269_cov_0.611765_1_plen_46_part_01